MTREVLALRDDVEDTFTASQQGEELPSQGGTYVPTILPGTHHLRLPSNLDQCWEAKDYEKKDAAGNVTGTEQHLLLKLDRDSPMIVVGGEFDGLPATATITTIGRKRGKKTDTNAPVVADMTYLVRDALADTTPVVKRKDWVPIVNKHAGDIIRIESGLSAQCDTTRVRYLDDGAGGVVEDPEGTMGCGNPAGKPNLADGVETRLYTQDFKMKMFLVPTTGEKFHDRTDAVAACTAAGVSPAEIKPVDVFSERAYCKNCSAALRGFFRIERYLKPLASTQHA